MNINEIKNMKKTIALPTGTYDVVFEKFEWRTDENGDVKGAWIRIKGYKPLYLTFFENNNYQLDYFLDQLGIDDYDSDIINEHTGTVIKVRRSLRVSPDGKEYINNDFNPNPKPTINADANFA